MKLNEFVTLTFHLVAPAGRNLCLSLELDISTDTSTDVNGSQMIIPYDLGDLCLCYSRIIMFTVVALNEISQRLLDEILYKNPFPATE